MAIEKLSVILELITGNYKKEARDAATATGQIGSAAATAGSSTSGMAGRMGAAGSLIKTAFAGVAVAAVADVLGNLDQLGQKMESTNRMADTVFGDMAADARAWADANNEAFGIGETAMLSLISKTQDLLVPMGFARDAAFDMSQEILNTANALSEWEGGTISAEDAQLRLAKAMLGEREGLVELGVKITDAEVKARLAAKGLDKLTGAARQQAIAQVTLELVMGKSTDALAAYEGRAGTATAAQKELAASTADTSESWAELLRGPLDEAKGVLADVTDIAEFLSEKMAETAGTTDEAGEATSGLVTLWKVATPAGALLVEVLDKIADVTREAGEETGKTSGKFGLLDLAAQEAAFATRDAADSIERAGQKAQTARPRVQSLVDVYVGLTDAMLASTDPIFNAVNAMRHLEEVRKDSAATWDEEAEAIIRAQSALNGLANGDIAAGIGIIAQALGISNEEARKLLEAAELLDGTEINMLIRWSAEGSPLPLGGVKLPQDVVDFINQAFPTFESEGLGGLQEFAGGGVVQGPLGSPQLIIAHGGEIVTPADSGMVLGGDMGMVVASSFIAAPTYVNKYGPTINVARPMDNFRQDLQYATIIASVTNLVEGL